MRSAAPAPRRVQAAGAAERDQHEVAWVVPALDRDHADRALHDRVRDTHDAGGRRRERPAQPARERRQRPLRPRAVEAHRPPRNFRLDQPAEHRGSHR
jgi:hypothetical protein